MIEVQQVLKYFLYTSFCSEAQRLYISILEASADSLDLGIAV
jgi:hypothetical protein